MLQENDDISRYREFHIYNFDEDVDFQKGWKVISGVSTPDQKKNLIKAKLYYYSKKYHPVSLTEYKSWLHQQGLDLEDDISDDKHTEDSDGNISQSCNSTENINAQDSQNEKRHSNISHSSSDEGSIIKEDNSCNIVKHSNGTTTWTPNDSEMLNLTEVADMIEKGLKLPGVKDLNIKPTESDPKSSTISRKKKPWEK